MDFGPGFVLSLACLTAGLTFYYFIKASHTERMAKIERGLLDDGSPDPYRSYLEVKLGMLFVGSGSGLLFAFALEHLRKVPGDSVLYPAFLFLFGGLSLLGSYFMVDRLRHKE
ncbi:MAG: hypothetical protein ACJAZ9_001584 [Neolewinella sp.]|jgi:hypothetical protein